jgi:hypothetical protein
MSVLSPSRAILNTAKLLLACSAVLCASAAHSTNTFDGQWVAEWNHNGNGMPVTTTISLHDGVGTFRNRVLHAERKTTASSTRCQHA